MNKFYYTKGQPQKLYSWLQGLISNAEKGKLYEVTYREYNKRSNNANAMYWACVESIAQATGQTNNEVHKRLIIDYSTSIVVSVKACVDMEHYAKYYTQCGETKLNGEPFIHYRIFKGSSDMTTKEFKRLLDGAIDECKELGVNDFE